MLRMLFVLLLASLIPAAGCDLLPISAGRSASPADDVERLKQLRQAIEREIGVPEANAADQCRTIALGVKPCGGPWTYLVYSTLRTSPARLDGLVRAYNRLDAKINRDQGLISDCMLMVDPGARLENGICRLGEE